MIDIQCHPPHPHRGCSMWKYKRQNAAKKQETMQAESECDEWRTFAGDTIVCRAIAPRTVEQLSIWIEIQNNMQDILLPSNSIKCIHCLCRTIAPSIM